jgi:hypothetical protein
MVASLVFLSGVISYSTFAESQPPVEIKDTKIVAINDPVINKTVLYVQWNTKIRNSAIIKINKEITCENKTYDLPNNSFDITPANMSVTRYIVLPEMLPVGSTCRLCVGLEWTPALSLKPHQGPHYSADFFVPSGSLKDINS